MNTENRQNILDAALQAILENGYHESIDDIATRAGVARQTIYNHFPGRDALLAETVSRMAEGVRISLDDKSSDLRSALLRFAAAYREKMLGDIGISLYRIVLSDAGRYPSLSQARAVFAANLSETRQRLAVTLGRAMAMGTLRRDDPEFASDVFLGMLNGAEQLRGLFYAELPANITPERDGRVVDCFLRAFRDE